MAKALQHRAPPQCAGIPAPGAVELGGSSLTARKGVSLRLPNLLCGRTAAGVQALPMNSLRSAWTPVLAGRGESYRQAKEDTEARPPELRSALYSLSDWYKRSVRSARW